MEDQLSEMMIEIINRTAKIESKLDQHTEVLNKIDKTLPDIKEKVDIHSSIFKFAGWFLGIIVSFFTAKLLGKI